MKRCVRCKQIKHLDAFHLSKNHPQGRTPRCIPCAVETSADWYRANKDKKRAYDAARRASKRDLYRAASKRFRDSSPGKKNADTQRRRAELAKRIPPWSDPRHCVAFYESAARVTQCLGIRHVVDHIDPLRGKHVSGLHLPINLRVIPERINLLKSNRFSA